MRGSRGWPHEVRRLGEGMLREHNTATDAPLARAWGHRCLLAEGLTVTCEDNQKTDKPQNHRHRSLLVSDHII